MNDIERGEKMKNLLAILLAIFVGISVIGCASTQKIKADAIRVCDYGYRATTPVGYLNIFYDNLIKGMNNAGLLLVGDTTHGGLIFRKEYLINRDEYILFVEVLVVSKIDEYNVLTQVPFYTISLKNRNWLGVSYRCTDIDDFSNAFYANILNEIINEAANLSKKKEPFVEIIDIPVGGER